jgi:hypothetical protein
MVDDPGLTLNAERAETWKASGPLSSRVLEFALPISERFRSYAVVDLCPCELVGRVAI